MVGTCFFSWLAARLGFGVFSLVIVLLGTNSAYRMEFRRFNRDIRDDMTRIHSLNRLENELETMEWLNSFLDKFWVIYMPALSEQVMFIANDILKDQAPGMGIEKLSLDEFTLGSKAPRVDSIKSYTRKGQDHIEMDWAFNFSPNDTDDMTKNEIKKKINPKVALGVTVGKAFISKSLPILVEDMSFTGRMNIKLKLTENFPHVKMVSVQFLEAPTIDYALKPVGGDTFGLDIMTFVPGLSSFVNTLIHGTLRPMLYAPNSLDIDVEELMAQQLNDSNGCIAVTVKKCIALKTSADTKENSINPYVQVKLSSNASVDERTKVKKQVNDPVFLDTKYLLVNKLEGSMLALNVYDFMADQPNDKLIGSVEFPLVDLLQKEVQRGLVKNLIESGKTVGKIEFDLRYFPTIPALTLDDGSKEENTDLEIGIMKINLHSAMNLDLSESVFGLLNPYAEIYVNDTLIKTCRRLSKTNTPSWDQHFESLITQQSETRIMVLVKDSANDNIVGQLDANLQDLIFESSRGQQWITCPPIKPNGPKPKIKISAQWKALGMTDDRATDYNFSAPIGGLRLHIRSASDLKNLEAIGEVDPYVKVMVNGKLRAKTNTIGETVDPIWNSVYFFPIDNENQHLLLSIMDAEPQGKDRSLGSCAINVKDFVKKNETGNYLAYEGSEEVIEQPVLYSGDNKGYLSYSVSFIPNLSILTHNMLKNKKLYEKHLKEIETKAQEKQAREEKLVKENPQEYEFIETDEPQVTEAERVFMPLQDIIKYRAGTLVVTILKGRFPKPDLYLHTLLDDHVFPSGVSPKLESRTLNVTTTAHGFIRDLPNSNLVFRVASRLEVKTQKDIIAEKLFSTIDILTKSYDKPIDLRINESCVIKVQLEFIPSAVKLHPLDTILDVGHLKMDILQGQNIPAADKNGKSDPLVVIKLDGIEVFKSDKKRKTLNPIWNELVNFPMLSRSRQILLVEVYDWDLTHDDRLLGRANLDLSTIEPHTLTPLTANLDTLGTVDLRVTFNPEYIRPKVGSAGGLPIDFKDVGAVPLKVVGGGVNLATNVVGGGVGLASDGVTRGGSFLKGIGRKKKKHGNDTDSVLESVMSHDGNKSRDIDDGDKSLGTSSTPIATPSESPTKSSLSHSDGQSKKSGQTPQPKVKLPQEENKEPVHTVPNIHSEVLPAPQRPGFGRSDSFMSSNSIANTTVDSMASSVVPNAIPGRLNIIHAKNYTSNSLEVKVTLKSPTRTKDIFKTRAAKLDKHLGLFRWNEGVPFKCSPDSVLVFSVREHHTFGKKLEVDSFEVTLQQAYHNHELDLQGSGLLIINLSYLSK